MWKFLQIVIKDCLIALSTEKLFRRKNKSALKYNQQLEAVLLGTFGLFLYSV